MRYLLLVAGILLVACEAAEVSNTQTTKQPTLYDASRVTKKPFGIYITQRNSPVSPERFNGYHAGTDFEVFEEEDPSALEVTAICSGSLHYKKWVNGYGGVAVQACLRGGEPITVLYGHLDINSIKKGIGAKLSKGDLIGVLGEGYSQQTDGERPHLHLSVHKGERVNLKGYVQREEELEQWFDPVKLLN